MSVLVACERFHAFLQCTLSSGILQFSERSAFWFLQIERAKELQVLLGYEIDHVPPVFARLCVLCTHAANLKLPPRYRMDKQLASRTSYQRTKCSVQ